jgi:hypothetical protein
MTSTIHGIEFRLGKRVVITIKVVASKVISNLDFLTRSKTIRAKDRVGIVYSRVNACKW